MKLSEQAQKNREFWDKYSDEYQARHAAQLNPFEPGWGVWQILERELNVLGEVEGKDILELGCGAAQWSIALARRGARIVALDNSERQLENARRLRGDLEFPLVHASAEEVPLASASFDVVFCDHGAMSFADPHRTVPEAARLLRPGGLLAFSMSSPLLHVCLNKTTDQIDESLHQAYFGLHRFDNPDGSVDFQLSYGDWVRLFVSNGFIIEDLIELRPGPDATTTYEGYVPFSWARQWPAEHIWKVRRRA